VRPGNELRVACEVLEVRPSKSRPKQGLVKIRTTTMNQNDEGCADVCLESGRAAAERQWGEVATLNHYNESRCREAIVAVASRLLAKVRSSARPFLLGFRPHKTEQLSLNNQTLAAPKRRVGHIKLEDYQNLGARDGDRPDWRFEEAIK
jgi:hypothetical protein